MRALGGMEWRVAGSRTTGVWKSVGEDVASMFVGGGLVLLLIEF